MNKILCICLLSACVISLTGCGQKEPVLPVAGGKDGGQTMSSAPSQASIVEQTDRGQAAALRVSPLEYAQKEYLDSYNEYVRLLRESGPQTIETLQALALYQKKYQIYQMLVKAEGERRP